VCELANLPGVRAVRAAYLLLQYAFFFTLALKLGLRLITNKLDFRRIQVQGTVCWLSKEASSWRVVDSIPDVTGFFSLPNPFSSGVDAALNRNISLR
jgi:hypothetical protein